MIRPLHYVIGPITVWRSNSTLRKMSDIESVWYAPWGLQKQWYWKIILNWALVLKQDICFPVFKVLSTSYGLLFKRTSTIESIDVKNHENSTINKSTNPAIDSSHQYKTKNCTESQKRHSFGGGCVTAVTPSVQGTYQHEFRPHEPYINDVTPINPITAMDSIPWIDDYQPIEPIQNDDQDGGDHGAYDDYEDRRNKIGNHILGDHQRRGQKNNITKGQNLRNFARMHFKLKKERENDENKQVLGYVRERNPVRTRRTSGSSKELGKMHIFPVRLQKLISNKIKRMIMGRLKLFNMSSMSRRADEKGLIAHSKLTNSKNAKRDYMPKLLNTKMTIFSKWRTRRHILNSIKGKLKIQR